MEQHVDFKNDPNEAKTLEKTKAWAQDMVENSPSKDKGDKILQTFIQSKHMSKDLKSLIQTPEPMEETEQISPGFKKFSEDRSEDLSP